jgi:hypothetical protein
MLNLFVSRTVIIVVDSVIGIRAPLLEYVVTSHHYGTRMNVPLVYGQTFSPACG